MTSPGAGLTSARQSAPAASARPNTNARIDASKSALVAVTRIGCGLRRDVPALLPQARHPTVGDPCVTHAGERARSDEGQRKEKSSRTRPFSGARFWPERIQVTDCPAEASMLVCCTYRAGTFICRHSGGVGECRGGRDPGGDREGARALRPRPEERRAIGGFHHPCRLCGGGARRPPLQRLI